MLSNELLTLGYDVIGYLTEGLSREGERVHREEREERICEF